ncbi:MAG TPA: TIGR02147 family protein, partial [Bdellovibrionales bacterium]|nr:TIGR02147 family protein [Bdellovibrionales bacterium]
YRDFVREQVQSMPNSGRGQLSRIAKHLSTSSVLVSYVMNGARDFSSEQAIEIADFFGLTETESDYFCLLVQLARAGSFKLEQKIQREMKKKREEAQHLKSRVAQDLELDDDAKARFYSNWYFSGIRLASSIDGLNSVEAIADYLKLPRVRVREVLEFLVQYGLSIEKNGEYSMGPKRTHIESTSPLVSRHHANWRIKGFESMEDLSPEELFYTGPMAVSTEAMAEVRKDLTDVIDRMVKKVGDSKSEQLACLNIDFFKLR